MMAKMAEKGDVEKWRRWRKKEEPSYEGFKNWKKIKLLNLYVLAKITKWKIELWGLRVLAGAGWKQKKYHRGLGELKIGKNAHVQRRVEIFAV